MDNGTRICHSGSRRVYFVLSIAYGTQHSVAKVVFSIAIFNLIILV